MEEHKKYMSECIYSILQHHMAFLTSLRTKYYLIMPTSLQDLNAANKCLQSSLFTWTLNIHVYVEYLSPISKTSLRLSGLIKG